MSENPGFASYYRTGSMSPSGKELNIFEVLGDGEARDKEEILEILAPITEALLALHPFLAPMPARSYKDDSAFGCSTCKTYGRCQTRRLIEDLVL